MVISGGYSVELDLFSYCLKKTVVCDSFMVIYNRQR